MRVTVVGAGVVGLAVAAELARGGHEVFVLEAASHPGAGTTSRNSEVIHAGLYYAPGSFKARLCVEGRDLSYAYLESRGLPHRQCGKLVVAVEDGEIAALEALRANAEACGVEGLEILDDAGARRLQPAVRCVAALWSPLTGVMDSAAFVRALRSDVERAGGTVVLCSRVTDAIRTRTGYRLTVAMGDEAEPFDCDGVVNSAGLASDLVARMPGGPVDDLPSLRFVRGSYARLWWPRAARVAPPDCLVYPLPDATGTGLGIHLTIDLAGGLRLGPDAEPLACREERYDVDDAIVDRFLGAARRYLELPDGASLTPDSCGIRPVRYDATGSRDFYIAEESARGLPGWINLIGIESPGLTAALAIGRMVAGLL